MNTFQPDRQPTFSTLTSGWSSSQHILRRWCWQTGHSSTSDSTRKRKWRAKMKARTAQSSWVNGMSWVVQVYLVVKLISSTNMNSFMLSVRQKCTLRYLRSSGQQQMATQRQALCTQQTAMMAWRGSSQSTVRASANSTFLRQLTNQKYLVRVLKLVRMRQVTAEKEQSRIHSGLISSSRALSSSRNSTTTSPARKKAETSAPAVAKAELKVRLATWVKMLMLSSISEKQKKTISRCSQRMLCSRFSHRHQQEVRPTSRLYSHTSSPSPRLACEPFYDAFYIGRPSMVVLMRLISSRVLRQLRTILMRMANKRTPAKTMSQVNWLPKKLAVLKSRRYLPKMLEPSVAASESSGSTWYSDPSARFWKVNELMLKEQSLTKNSSSCWGKYMLMKTIRDSSCTSSTVLQTKYFMPFTNTAHSPSASVPAMNTTISTLTRMLKLPSAWHTPFSSSSAFSEQQHMPQTGRPPLPRLASQLRQSQQRLELQLLEQLQWQQLTKASNKTKVNHRMDPSGCITYNQHQGKGGQAWICAHRRPMLLLTKHSLSSTRFPDFHSAPLRLLRSLLELELPRSYFSVQLRLQGLIRRTPSREPYRVSVASVSVIFLRLREVCLLLDFEHSDMPFLLCPLLLTLRSRGVLLLAILVLLFSVLLSTDCVLKVLRESWWVSCLLLVDLSCVSFRFFSALVETGVRALSFCLISWYSSSLQSFTDTFLLSLTCSCILVRMFLTYRMSFQLQNSERYSCLSTCYMVSRFLGSNCSSFWISCRHLAGGRFTKNSDWLALRLAVSSCSMAWLLPPAEERCFISEGAGVPVQASTRSIWLMVELPGNMALPLNISPITHPSAHMSTSLLYSLEPSSSQGALYQRVAMQSVIRGISPSPPSSSSRTSPKSHSLASQFSLTSTLEGLRSRWMRLQWCSRYIALATWQIMYCLCRSCRLVARPSSRMSVCRSTSMCSKTRQMSRSLRAGITRYSWMTLGCRSWRRNMTSRQVRWASVELQKASKFFLRALTVRVARSTTFQTCPQAPLPIFLATWNCSSTCGSISSVILQQRLRSYPVGQYPCTAQEQTRNPHSKSQPNGMAQQSVELPLPLLNRMADFCAGVQSRGGFYLEFQKVMEADFHEIMQEEINTCVCCGRSFEGKSIGPHYKNSARCAEFKRAKEGTRRREGGVQEEEVVMLEEAAGDSYDVDAYFESF